MSANVEPARYTTLETAWRSPPPPPETRTEMERNCLALLCVRRDVAEILGQPQPIAYVDDEGFEREHAFSFIVTMRDGRRLALDVKSFSSASEKSRWHARMKLIASQTGDFAEGYVIVTDEQLPDYAVHNAKLIRSARRNVTPEHDEVVRALMSTAHGRVKISNIVEVTGLEGNGFIGVVHLIDSGELTLVGPHFINYPTEVKRSVSLSALLQ
jgi:hypothetical protein